MTTKQSRNLDDLVRRIADSLPDGVAQLNADVRRNLKEVISASLSRMNLVSREEFEVQSAVLARTREKLERLEAQVAALEKGGAKDSGDA
ncbi:MAG TPA: accessory factor UbiK family protein, partial [Gammaproteobacteria bacterium]|nr:accessory factor UbiK family protein [Gammaproteobacteria bacterium]